MGDVATPVNDPAKKANYVERKLIDVLILGAVTAAKIYVPFLNFPVVSQVFGFLMGKFGDIMYVELALGTTFSIIDHQTKAEKIAFDEAMAALAASRQAAGDYDEHARALQRAKDAFDRLVHSDGSARP